MRSSAALATPMLPQRQGGIAGDPGQQSAPIRERRIISPHRYFSPRTTSTVAT